MTTPLLVAGQADYEISDMGPQHIESSWMVGSLMISMGTSFANITASN